MGSHGAGLKSRHSMAWICVAISRSLKDRCNNQPICAAGYRYGSKWVRDETGSGHSVVIVLNLGACNGVDSAGSMARKV